MQFAFIAQIIDGTPEDRFVPHLKAEAQRALGTLRCGRVSFAPRPQRCTWRGRHDGGNRPDRSPESHRLFAIRADGRVESRYYSVGSVRGVRTAVR